MLVSISSFLVIPLSAFAVGRRNEDRSALVALSLTCIIHVRMMLCNVNCSKYFIAVVISKSLISFSHILGYVLLKLLTDNLLDLLLNLAEYKFNSLLIFMFKL